MRVICLVGALLVGCGGTPPAPPPPVDLPPPAPEVKPAEPAKVDLAAMSEADRKAWLLKKGEEVYNSGGSGGIACVTCHQATGEGLPPSFPPLKGQKDFMGDCVHHAGLIVHGLQGEITINGTKFNGTMPAQPTLSDEEIAAAISYERSSWGNDFGPCMPEDVAKARSGPAPTP